MVKYKKLKISQLYSRYLELASPRISKLDETDNSDNSFFFFLPTQSLYIFSEKAENQQIKLVRPGDVTVRVY